MHHRPCECQITLRTTPELAVGLASPDDIRQRACQRGARLQQARMCLPIGDRISVLPIIASGNYAVYPAEPAEPMFSEIVQGLSSHLREYDKQQPRLAAAFKKNEQALYALLKPSWTSASRVQDAVTAGAIGALTELQAELLGPVLKDAEVRWDRHAAEAVIKAVNEHPGKRVLVLTGIRNRPTIKLYLAAVPGIGLVDMPAWLAKAGY